MTVINVMTIIFFILTSGDIIFYFLCRNKENFMKVYISITLIYAVIFASVFPIIAVISVEKNKDNSSKPLQTEPYYYEMTATAVNENTFVTEDGNMWRMKNINIEKGKKYQLTFDNHDTEIITDDEIIDFIELNEKVD